MNAAVRLVAVIALAVCAPVLAPAAAKGLADQTGWPPYEMLLMNKDDSSRPLDARPGRDPFGGQDPDYSCDSLHGTSASCRGRFVDDGRGGYVVTSEPGHSRLLGGHGSDRIHASPFGDVLWGDHKPSGQPRSQRDKLWGGAGHDFVYASHGHNVILAGGRSDAVHGYFGRGRVDCGAGRDVLYVRRGHRGRWQHRGCEVISTRTGRSAPRWMLRKLPWYRPRA